MTTRWEVERAIQRTNIRPLGRFLVLTLLVKADNETAQIPPEFTPSLSTLVAATGLARSAVAEHLRYLEDLGWVKRSMPARKSKYDRTQYALLVGRDDPNRPSSPPCEPDGRAVRTEDYSSSPHHGLAVVRTEDYSTDDASGDDDVSAGNEQSATRTTESSSPPHGHASTNNLSTKGTTKSRPPKQPKPKPDRPDVEEICAYLADKIGTHSRRPAVTAEWRTEARLLLDEKRPVQPTVERVKKVIDWCQGNTFWRKNVMSMPKFRKQYDRLRLEALDDHKRAQSANTPYRNPTDQNDYDEWNRPR